MNANIGGAWNCVDLGPAKKLNPVAELTQLA